MLVFELVSAFGGIGLSLGIPTENYSFSGAFGPLSKLIVMVIMVRGRHRGLPVAIDRASTCYPCYIVNSHPQWINSDSFHVCSYASGGSCADEDI